VRADSCQNACMHDVRVIYEDKGPLFWFEVRDGLKCPRAGCGTVPKDVDILQACADTQVQFQGGFPDPKRLQVLAAHLVANKLLCSKGKDLPPLDPKAVGFCSRTP